MILDNPEEIDKVTIQIVVDFGGSPPVLVEKNPSATTKGLDIAV